MNSVLHPEAGELFSLLDLMIDDNLSTEQAERLEELVLSDNVLMHHYVDYMNLHGNLFWDAAYGSQELPAVEIAAQPNHENNRRRLVSAVAAIACLLMIGLVTWQAIPPNGGQDTAIVENVDDPATVDPKNSEQDLNPDAVPQVVIPNLVRASKNESENNNTLESIHVESQNGHDRKAIKLTASEIVAKINDSLESDWKDQRVEPSVVASDSEWVRRAFLDVAGRIPTVSETEAFLAEKSDAKRAELVSSLIENGEFARHWTTVWSNLLVGRLPRNRNVNLIALREFLYEDFSKNRGWNETVADIIAAEGDPNKNGEANFLVAHLNNQAVPATAVTCRLFLGMQIQCTQCHNHPSNDWTQQDFWELNSFFKQAKVERKESGVHLVSQQVGGPTFFQSRRGIMKVAYPKFGGNAVSETPDVNRRSALAKMLSEGSQPQLASSMVNRVWAHFFGYGFVNPVDDMGPHNAASHPELLEFLSEQLIQSGYDVQALVGWITTSRAYQLSSRFNDKNSIDNPEIGEPPLFSRMYVKPMTAEQIYDSLLVASQRPSSDNRSWTNHVANRDQWVRQFFRIYQTEENDEDSNMNGTIPQALEFMNGALVRSAVTTQTSRKRSENLISKLADSKVSDATKVRKLCLAALSREPTTREMTLFKKYLQEHVRQRVDQVPRNVALGEGLQDVYWAYLNSCEFVLVP